MSSSSSNEHVNVRPGTCPVQRNNSMPVKYLKIIPYITAFVLFMMVHDYLQEILQLQFSVANLVLPNVFTLFDCLGCVAGPLLYIYISSKQQIISATGQPPQPLSQKQHPFVHQLSLQKDHLRSVFLPLAILTTVGRIETETQWF
jgi:hypothetical protein